MKTKIELITPEYAGELLKKNTINRIANENIISEYSRQMTAGLWNEFTGESIKIASDGTLLDGQQRLYALIKSNLSLTFLITYDLDKDVFKVLDTGKKRNAKDVFHCAGINNSTNTSSGIRKYLMLKADRKVVSRGYFGGGISNSELIEIYNARIKFWSSVATMAQSWYKNSSRFLGESEFIGYYAYFYDIDSDDAFTFIDLLSSGIGLTANDPIYKLRSKLMLSKVSRQMKLSSLVKNALIIKTWNMFRKGKQGVKLLKFDAFRDEFPTAI